MSFEVLNKMESMPVKSIRWQDWADVVLGCWLVISPWELDYSLNAAARGNAYGIGAVLITFNLISACRLVEEGQEIFNIVLGIWLALSPFSFGYAPSEPSAEINSIIVGVMIIGLACWQIVDAARNGKQ